MYNKGKLLIQTTCYVAAHYNVRLYAAEKLPFFNMTEGILDTHSSFPLCEEKITSLKKLLKRNASDTLSLI